MPDFPLLGSYVDTVDDIERACGEEVANRVMWEIFTYGTTGKRKQEFPATIECCLTLIQAKIDKSQERKERVASRNASKSKGKNRP